MHEAQYPKTSFQEGLFIVLVILLVAWAATQVVTGAATGAATEAATDLADFAGASGFSGSHGIDAVAGAMAETPVTGEAQESRSWFVVDEKSRWTDQEVAVVEQVMEHSWAALASVGVDGETLLDGYRFRRLAAEFVPGEERLLAIVDHQRMEIVLADGAFQRLHGFYIYHEVGHAVDRQLERLPSEAYHRMAGEAGEGAVEDGAPWATANGFWLRYHGRDDREEATADAFAWWVMSQFGQPKPFFPGTPVTTDYDDIAQTFETALGEAVSSSS